MGSEVGFVFCVFGVLPVFLFGFLGAFGLSSFLVWDGRGKGKTKKLKIPQGPGPEKQKNYEQKPRQKHKNTALLIPRTRLEEGHRV